MYEFQEENRLTKDPLTSIAFALTVLAVLGIALFALAGR